MKQLGKTLPSVTINLDKKSYQIMENKTRQRITTAIDTVKLESKSINEGELKYIF